MQSVSAFREEFLAAWRTCRRMGDPPFRHDWPPHLGKGEQERDPTPHEERLSAIAFARRQAPLCYEAAQRRDFLGLGGRRTAQVLGLSEQAVSRRCKGFWTALQAHLCSEGCEDCGEICRRA